MSGRYLKQWEPDWLSKVIAKIEAAPARQPTVADSSTLRPRRLDRRLSADTIAELVDAYEAGAPTPELCARYGLSKGGILKLLREAGVKMRKQPLSEAQIRQAARLYAEGYSLRAVAAELGSSFSTVREALLAQGVTMRRPTR
ncbi:helix-turn-helix domain-containing protein [Nocardia brasiliensis]|uniref:helix-turn-helix domain-containing protein n=1 Tax=Nocardia brasiliensis TaxID=37326 RepID=UPI003D91F9F8